ncbi:MAG: efflux RND transporter periplasmic adaptor subunit [Acidobacteriota bacterium]|nr:efflux RND transporter periplasmic adaptor subunit [Acidobacteriota bacterium]
MDRRVGRWLQPLLWMGCGFLLFLVLFIDPLQLHSADTWLQARVGFRSEETNAKTGDEAETGFWTCGMHPHVLAEEPGECPICRMDLVQVSGPSASSSAGEREILFYRNPMDPKITSPVPSKDEMGMDYVPIYVDEADRALGAGTTVTIDPAVVQNMNVQSIPVERRDLTHEIRTVGYLEYDQERMVTVTTKYSGWIEKVYVNHVGEPVRKGQPLFEIYSPDLIQTEQELLSAIEYAGKFEGAAKDARRRAMALVDAARTRLSYWDIAPEQIARLEETGEIFRTLKVVASSSGLVMKRMPGLEGMAVKPGMETYHIADLSSLWLSVEIFEDQVAWIHERSPATVAFTYFPGKTFRGMVRFIEPAFSEKTRTLKVKIEIPNPDGQFRAGMFATVVFEPVAAREAITVPSLAVLRSGQRNVVVVDLGRGRFEPRPVTLGHEGDGYVEVIEGIDEGERVVTSAQFLIDSEASLQEAIQKMIAQRRGE